MSEEKLLLYKTVPITIYIKGKREPENDWRLAYWKFETKEMWGLLYRDDPTHMRYYLDRNISKREPEVWFFDVGNAVKALAPDLEEALRQLDIWG